jgi:hypothetical protein
MLIVGNAVIDDDVASASFCCDLAVCKGACCCLAGGRGAPLDDGEVEEIRKAYPLVRQYLPETNIRTIEASGLVEGTPGDYATACVNDRECVFTTYEHGIAFCAFEKAFNAGLSPWQKPLSCHLFPIRVRRFGRDFVRYEQIAECDGGRERGMREKVKLGVFLRTPLTRKFGASWYRSFRDLCGGPTDDRTSSC